MEKKKSVFDKSAQGLYGICLERENTKVFRVDFAEKSVEEL